MSSFANLSYEEAISIDAGGPLAAIAGAIAGTVLGGLVGTVSFVITGNPDNVAQGMAAGGSLGLWAGLGFPIP